MPAELPRIAPHLLSRAAVRANDLGLFNAGMCASLGGIGLTVLHLEDKQGFQTTLNWTRAILACPNLESLELICFPSLRDGTLQPCLEMLGPKLARLSIEKCSGVTGAALSVLAGSRVLRSLDVSGSSVSSAFLTTVVPTLAELVLLDVSGTRFAFEQAEVVLPSLRKLKEFFCCATKLDEGRESSLRLLGPSVTHAYFRFSEHLYDIAWLRGWTQLTAIDLSLCPRLEDAMLRPLRELPVLAKINISKTMVTDTGFAALAQIPTLSHVDAEGLGLTDGIGPALRGMARLEHLNLLFTLEISDDIVPFLPTGRLRCLKLPYRPTGTPIVTDAALSALALLDLPGLQTLSLGGKGITDGCINDLLALTDTLEQLSLWHTKVTAPGAERIKAGTGLSIDDSMRATKGTFILVP